MLSLLSRLSANKILFKSISNSHISLPDGAAHSYMANVRDYPPRGMATHYPWRQTYSHGGFTVNAHHSTNLTWTNACTGKGSVDWRRMHGTEGLPVKERLSIENTGIQAMESYVLIHVMM